MTPTERETLRALIVSMECYVAAVAAVLGALRDDDREALNAALGTLEAAGPVLSQRATDVHGLLT